jgi:hypothetical protein
MVVHSDQPKIISTSRGIIHDEYFRTDRSGSGRVRKCIGETATEFIIVIIEFSEKGFLLLFLWHEC